MLGKGQGREWCFRGVAVVLQECYREQKACGRISPNTTITAVDTTNPTNPTVTLCGVCVVLCDVVQCVVVWCRVVLCGVVWYSVVQCGAF
jgi:hypothetical protein